MSQTTRVHISEPHDVNCTRQGGIWGNPYKMHSEAERDYVVDMHRRFLLQNRSFFREAQLSLKGKRLACVCPPGKRCHVDNYVELL